MSSSLQEYVGVRDIYVPVMPATRQWYAELVQANGKPGKVTVRDETEAKAVKQIKRLAKEVFPGCKLGDIELEQE